MKVYSHFLVSVLTVAAALLLLPAAHAQRADNGRPADDPFGRRVVPARAVPGGRYKSHAFTNNALLVEATDGSHLQLTPWAGGVLKVDYFPPGHSLTSDTSISVVQQMSDTRRTGWGMPAVFKQFPNSSIDLLINTGPLSGDIISIHKDPLRIILYAKDTSAPLSLSQSLPSFDVAVPFRREAAAPTSATTAEPGGTAVRFRLAPGERLYGTGSRALPVDRRGYRLELYNQAHYGSQNNEPNLNITLPTVLSSRGYMLFFDNHAPGYLDLGKTDKNVLEYGGEGLASLSYFVITGRDQAEILNRYTALTGRQPLPPRWALGLIQSRFGYKTEAEMQQVATRMRHENFPLDALVLDLYWFGGTTRQGDLSWYQPGFPDPAGMMSRLNQQGVKTILISEPYVMRTSRNDSTVRTRGLVGTTAAGRPFTVASFWAGPASILDVFKPAARNWLWGYYRTLHNQGAAGWWSDLGEPENHPEAMHHVGGPARAVHNAYGQAWASIFQENYAREFPEERVFNLARSGWAGMQRNSVFPWSGDINRSWSGYQAQIPVMLGMGQGGVGYMHSDAGGFCVGGIDPELYTRWLQMASLCPILRPHGEGVPPEPYYYPNPYKSSVRDAVQLRYQLLPYLYTLAWQNATTGAPLVRTMDFDYQYASALITSPAPPTKSSEASYLFYKQKVERNTKLDSTTENNGWDIPLPIKSTQATAGSSGDLNDQYLLGPNLLVAPVLNPSQRRRNVLLPNGNWIDFYTNQTYAGGRTVSVPAPLAHAPLLVRAGAFLPMTAYRPSTAQYRPDTLLLRYYPDPATPESEFTMYDDDGHSAQALARHQYETLTMRGFCTPKQTDVILSSNGDYPGQPAFRLLRLLVQRVAAPPTAVYLDNQLAPAEGYAYDPVKHELEVHFLMNAGVAVSIRGLRLLNAPATGTDPESFTLEVPDSRSFGPNGTTLSYVCDATSGAAGLLLIRNAQGGVVRTLSLDPGPGRHVLAWDGRDDRHRPVPPGVYVAETAGQHQRLIVTQ
ncbi:TIM-barrel domain-containing protein [Hymenobacter terricola]|uniref:TIM-barrel domain-containing protein n=1 Tax=Hymenobacter terricola TaxID=2819236 RepID=UPI001B300740|nr:TIM-barrel domain-containing protein [Hymenobacter terricola]